MTNSVVMLPDCKSEYYNASAVPGERNIALFTALLGPEKQPEKQLVSLADGNWGQSKCNAKFNYQHRATGAGSVAVTANCFPRPPRSATGSDVVVFTKLQMKYSTA